ncbi:MAG TPA: coiled-coil domain-containing protein [Rhodocyclaceae bacterium]|nr:coiled-coil domain-containing protein [Rhodocyclaceae bacterium]
MTVITFDTLKFVKELESAGVPAAQAEAQARALATALDTHLVELATKGDVREVRVEANATKAELKSELALLRSEMQAMESRLTIKFGALIAVAVGVSIAVLRGR